MGSQETEGTIELAIGRVPAPPPPEEPRLGRVPYDVYELGDEIGRGGLGRVVRATDRRLGREVAIKELLPTKLDNERRFTREARVTARLEHPAIVPVHEAGRWPNGQPFYAMKLISGRPLSEAIRQAQTLVERLALVPGVIAIAEAIAYAHSKRVIHRDIKPANVIIGNFGEVMVIDWGLAKQLADPSDVLSGEQLQIVEARAGETVAGAVLGTPSYMPPEQARGLPVDERADVYALGALLYHVLAGVPPYDPLRSRLESSGPAPVSDVERPPRAATEVLADVLAHAPPRLERRVPQVPRDLADIVEKAMARDPEQRYPTARELAEDLMRFQTGQLVSARQYSTASLLRRWIARHRAAVAVFVAANLVLAAGATYAVSRILHARDAAELARRDAEARSREAASARSQAEARRNALFVSQARGVLERDPTAALAWLKQLPADATSNEWRAAQAIAADAWSRGAAERVWVRHTAGVWQVAVSADGTTAASASVDGTVAVYDLATGDARVIGAHGAEVNAVAFEPTGRLLASGGDDGRILLWADGAPRPLSGHAGSVTGLAFSPDGAWLASIGYDRSVRLWRVADGSGRVLGKLDGRGQGVAFTPDGTRLVSVADGEPVRLWDVAAADGAPRTLGAARARAPKSVAVSRDGKWAAVANFGEHQVAVVELATGAVRELDAGADTVMGVAFAPDGRLASAGSDKRIRIWDLASGTSRQLVGHRGSVNGVAFTPDGRRLVSGGGDREVRLWRLPDDDATVLRAHDGRVAGLSFRRDGRLVTGGVDGVLRVWDVASRAPEEWLRGAPIDSIEHAADGRLVVAADDGAVRVFAPGGGAPRLLDGGRVAITAFSLAPSGVAAWLDELGVLRVRPLDGAPGDVVEVPEADQVAISPDGARVVWNVGNEVWSCRVGACKATRVALEARPTWVKALQFTADGTLAIAGGGGSVRIIGPDGARQLSGLDATVGVIAFSPEGLRLAAGGYDGGLAAWSVATGELRRLRGHGLRVEDVLFSPDGRLLASSATDGTVRLADVASGRGRVLGGHEGRVSVLAFSPDGTTLASAGAAGVVRLWRADPSGPVPVEAEALQRWLRIATTAVVGEGDVVVSP